MSVKSNFTQHYLMECFTYEPVTGLAYWNTRPLHHFEDTRIWKSWNSRFAGKQIVCLDADGYIQLTVNYLKSSLHTLVWVYMTGSYPVGTIDHFNGVRNDNRWVNLRLANRGEQQHNRGINKNNTSGYKGISFHKASGKWRARITYEGVERYLGVFNTPHEAHAAVVQARQQLHGAFARSA